MTSTQINPAESCLPYNNVNTCPERICPMTGPLGDWYNCKRGNPTLRTCANPGVEVAVGVKVSVAVGGKGEAVTVGLGPGV